MENFLLTLQIVLPLFLLMALGFAMRRLKLLDEHTAEVLNNAVYKVFLPAMLFRNIYNTAFEGAFDGRLVLFAYASILCLCGLATLAVCLLVKDNSQRSVIIQTIYRSNFVIFGLPLTESILGEGQAGGTALLIAFVVPLFNIMAVCIFEIFREGKVTLSRIARGVLTNPLVIASALGLLVQFTGLRLPQVLETVLADVAKVATPLALITLGALIEFRSVPGHAKQLTIGIVGRLVAVPLLGMPAAVLLGFRGTALVALLAMFCTPTAVSSFTMGKQMGGDGELAAQLVVLTSAFSVFTVFLSVYALLSLGLL